MNLGAPLRRGAAHAVSHRLAPSTSCPRYSDLHRGLSPRLSISDQIASINQSDQSIISITLTHSIHQHVQSIHRLTSQSVDQSIDPRRASMKAAVHYPRLEARAHAAPGAWRLVLFLDEPAARSSHPRRGELSRGDGADVLRRSRFSSWWLSLYRQPPPCAHARAGTHTLYNHQPPPTCLPAPAHPCARPLRRAGHEPEVVAPLAEAQLVFVVLLIEPAEENFMCGCGAVLWQGHGLVLGQCDRSACLVAHLRMGGCRQSGQMRCWCMHVAC
eukprot:COSAG06_NODE_15533_length_1063_cov_10.250000_1_plen_272_part_00